MDSHIDGSPTFHFPEKTRRWRLRQSFIVTFLSILLVIGVVASIYIVRFQLTDALGDGYAQTIASIINAIVIQITNYTYNLVAISLTDYENHRTNTEYEDQIIMKIFVFQFINSYASFYYLAFVAEPVGDCPNDDCMSSLAINLGIIFATRLLTKNLIDIVIPYFQYKWKCYKEYGEADIPPSVRARLSRPEKDYLLLQVSLFCEFYLLQYYR